MQGGGTAIFAAIPLNIMNTGTADYLVTGEIVIFIFLIK